MTLIALGSVAGAPGVTRLALGLAASWPESSRRRVVVEVDPDGGRLGAELGVGVEPGLMALALAARAGGLTADDVLERGAAAVADWYVVPAPPSSEQAHSALVHAGSSLAAMMAADHDDHGGSLWLADTGRLSTRSPALPFAKVADHVVIVSQGSFPALQLVPHRVDALRQAGCVPSVVVVDPTAWAAEEIAAFVGADVIAVLPHVRNRGDSIAAMRGSAWRAWWRAVEHTAEYLAVVPVRAEP